MVNGISILNGNFGIKSSTVLTANGVVFTYIRSPQESVSTTGPLSQPLTVVQVSIAYHKMGCFVLANFWKIRFLVSVEILKQIQS